LPASSWSALMFFYFSFGLPTVESLKDYKPSAGTVILADDGRVLGQIKIEKGTYAPLSRVPKFLKDALLATEDPRFYQHKGLDYRGILRAALKDIIAVKLKQGGKHDHAAADQGGVPVVGAELLAQDQGSDPCPAAGEGESPRNEILELYFNKVYFGHGAYGVQMAAKTYFGKKSGRSTRPRPRPGRPAQKRHGPIRPTATWT